uniref:Uncharacterized protein n=1 Tax=Tanacetum cinerariifolium TaxID=118510 RepID=A0A699IHD5_TANCI|nr:hypothetical protein [Tanacetum cinerariifolium]
MATLAIPVFSEENLGDLIDIRMDIIHPEPVAAVLFLHQPLVDIVKAENATLRARIKTTEAIEKITRKRKRQLGLRLSNSWLRLRSPSVRTERISGSSKSS